MLPSEQELSVEIAHINCVQIDLKFITSLLIYNGDLSKACERKSFHDLASDSSCTHHQKIAWVNFSSDIRSID